MNPDLYRNIIVHNGAFFLHNSERILLASQIKPTISSRETCAAGSVKRQLTRGLLENCLFRWAAHPFRAGYSDASSLDLNLHKHAEPRARRKAVTLCTGLTAGRDTNAERNSWTANTWGISTQRHVDEDSLFIVASYSHVSRMLSLSADPNYRTCG